MRHIATSPRSPPSFLNTYFYLSLIAACYAPVVAAQPVIDWVTPPVWIQTQAENTSAMPGAALTGRTWITTGRGGKAMIRLGSEQVEVHENSLWEWAGQNDGSSGNAVQGSMHVSTVVARGLPASVAPEDLLLRLQQDAPWMLLLDAGKDQSAAEGLVNYLRNSGYPVGEAQRIKRFFGDKWQIAMNGFISSEAATAMSERLIALAPGTQGATVQRAMAALTDAISGSDAGAENAAASSQPPGSTPEALPDEATRALNNSGTHPAAGSH